MRLFFLLALLLYYINKCIRVINIGYHNYLHIKFIVFNYYIVLKIIINLMFQRKSEVGEG